VSSRGCLERACGSACTLYAFKDENMVYLAAGGFLGDLTGAPAYRLAVPAHGDAELRYRLFSSRRRHTRLTCDWSSDVCSSDLLKALQGQEETLLADLTPVTRAKV